jgi:hypothetical protein
MLYITDIGNLYVQLRNSSAAPWFSPTTLHQVVKEIFEWVCESREGSNSTATKQWEDFFYANGCSVGFFDTVESSTEEGSFDFDSELMTILSKFSKKHMLIQELSKYSKIEEAQG